MLKALINIFRTPELRKKILITMALLVVCRIGVYVPIPGVNTKAVTASLERTAQGEGSTDTTSKVINLVDMFTGGALYRCTVFALGVMPYISASIIFQLLTTVWKPLEELAKEGEAGRKKIHQYERYATVMLCVVQGLFVARYVAKLEVPNSAMRFVDNPSIVYYLCASFSIAAGTMFLMWIGEQITELGIGNGVSLIIMGGIVARMPSAIYELRTKFEPSLAAESAGKFGLLMAGVLVVMYLAVVVGVVVIQQAQRRITVQQAKHTRGRRVYGGQQHFLPLRVNQAGVIPIIFAQSLLYFPAIVITFVADHVGSGGIQEFLRNMGNQLSYGFLYVMLYIGMIVFFCFFWTAVVFNPIKMADDLKQYGHFIPGIRPGSRTADYLEKLMTRITLAGAAFLAAIAILPLVINRGLDLGYSAASLYGGTGLLIVVGVALDMLQKIDSHLVMRNYPGFLKAGKIRGRR